MNFETKNIQGEISPSDVLTENPNKTARNY